MAKRLMKCVKISLVVFNIICMLASVAVLILGGILLFKPNTLSETPQEVVKTSAIICLVYGAVFLLISCFGCVAVIKENRCMLITFAVLVGIVFILQILAVVYLLFSKEFVEEVDEEELKVSSLTYFLEGGFAEWWDKTQREFKCCGVYNSSTWENLYYAPDVDRITYPDSCCVNETVGCGAVEGVEIYTEGCLDKYIQYDNTFLVPYLIVAGVVIGLTFIELLAVIVFACSVVTANAVYKYKLLVNG